MVISEVRVYSYPIKLPHPFKTSLGETSEKEEIIVQILDESGRAGWGEASPSTTILASTPATITAALEQLAPILLGEDPRRLEWLIGLMDEALNGNSPAKAALDIALHDLVGNIWNEPVWIMLGGYKAEPIDTDYTVVIGPVEEMVADAKGLVARGFDTLKIKVGLDPAKDIKAVTRIREAVGEGVNLRIDANQGYTRQEAVWALRRMEELGIQFVEQPVAAADIEGLRYVRQKTGIPVMADESVFSPADAIRVIKEEAVDYINIKLMKSGGLFRARQIADIATAAGIQCMIGGMVETNLSATAAIHFAKSHQGIAFRDLDLGVIPEERLITVGGATLRGKFHYLDPGPGLGIKELDTERLGEPLAVYEQSNKGRWERKKSAV